MTYSEIIQLPKYTQVRIKEGVDCHRVYKEGGILIFDDEIRPGIKVKDKSGIGKCFQFKPEDYELL